ncbi:unnamed protein product [Onchocerca flexuosa]|uniref:Uncharacterized protein n=1 Tax=Onchocerca flexuosa TaxID=387005 RepID=A0A3P7VXX8_9BILA|nr:unnamed protein product [Onchocerca flexuosa]
MIITIEYGLRIYNNYGCTEYFKWKSRLLTLEWKHCCSLALQKGCDRDEIRTHAGKPQWISSPSP